MKLRIGRNTPRFRANEKGAALTEFTFFLPIWIVVFIGIINLGRVGVFATQVQLQAQKELWDQAIDVTAKYTSTADQMSPAAAALFTGGEYTRLSTLDGNDQPGNDGIEILAQIPLGAYGHFGESAEKSTIPLGMFVPESVRMKYEPTDIMGQSDQSRYPHKIVNDTLADQNYSSGGIGSILTSIVAASGLVAAVGAGIRYGSVFADKDEQTTFMANAGTFRAGAHYDVLVPPRAVPSTESEAATFAISFLMFKVDEQYDEFMLYGKKNWDSSGTAPSTPSGDKDDFKDSADNAAQDDIEKECKTYCSDNAGWDDEDNPQPKPPNWDKCKC